MMKKYFWILVIFAIGFFLRIYKLSEYPKPINQDELVNMHNGWMIYNFGMDDWGYTFPLQLKGLGQQDYRPVFYAYSSIPIFSILGYSVFSGRLLSAILGCLTLVLLFYFLKERLSKPILYFSLLLFAFSPWHILYSRQAHEGTSLVPFFIMLIIFLLGKLNISINKNKYFILLGLSIGTGLNTYQSFRVVFVYLILAIPVFYLIKMYKKQSKWKSIGFVLMFFLVSFLFAFPQIFSFIDQPEHYFNKFTGVVIPFENSYSYYSHIISNIFSHFKYEFLFDSKFRINNLSIQREYSFLMPFYFIGMLLFIFNIFKGKIVNFFLLGLLLFCILPSALTVDSPHALRASGMLVFTPIFISIAFESFFMKIKTFSKMVFKISVGIFSLIFFLSLIQFFNNYFKQELFQEPTSGNVNYRTSLRLKEIGNKYDKIYSIRNSNLYYYILNYTLPLEKQFLMDKNMYEESSFIQPTHFENYYFIDSVGPELDTLKNTFLLISNDSNLKNRFNQFQEPIFFAYDSLFFYVKK